MTPASKRTFWQVLILCLLVYLLSAKGDMEVEDSRYSVETAQAILHGHLAIPHSPPYTLPGPDGASYSKYGIGLALYYVPWVAVGNVLTRVVHRPPMELTTFLLSFANIPFALLTLILFNKLLKLFGVAGVSTWLLPLALGLGTLAWHYAVSDFSEEMQMCFLLMTVYGVVRGTSKTIAVAGAAFAALFLIKLLYLAFWPLFACYLLTRTGDFRDRIRNAALFTFPVVLAGGAVGWLNAARFGNPFESGYGHDAYRFLPLQIWHTVPLLLGSLDKGLFLFCPILIIGLFGWRQFLSRYRREALLCGGVLLVSLLLTGAYYYWDGGWSWGPRYLVPLVPLWLLPAAFWLERERSRARYGAFVALMLASILAQIPGILVKDNEIHVIKQQQLTEQERPSAPSEYVTACLVLWHKLGGRNEIYRVSDFHIPGDHQFDLTRYRTFNGFNVWTELVAQRMKIPDLRWLSLVALVMVGCLAIQIGLEFRGAMKPAILGVTKT